jgi:hypothetical protein
MSIVCEGSKLRRQHVFAVSIEVRAFDDVQIALRPIDGTSFWSKAAVGSKKGRHHIRAA